MKSTVICFVFFAALLALQSCTSYQHLYYTSPLNGKNNSYVAMPLANDSAKVANYAHISAAAGYTSSAFYAEPYNFILPSGGSYQFDKYLFLETGLYQTRKFNNFQAYYGGNICYGNYKQVIAGNSNKTFFTLGAMGGINYVIKMRHSEWRILGLEFSSNREYGSYLNFRKDSYDSLTTVLIKNPNYTTLGLSTEFLEYNKKGSFGAKLSFGGVLEKEYIDTKTNDIYSKNRRRDFYYSTFTLSHTVNKTTAYMQANKGIQTAGFKFGVVYRL